MLAARVRPDLVSSLILLAPAPDFTRDVYEAFSESQKNDLLIDGAVKIPNDYSDEPYIFTRALIEDGERHCLLTKDIDIEVPVSIIQGMEDKDVPWDKAILITERLRTEDVSLHLLKSAGHSLSGEAELSLLKNVLEQHLGG